MEESTRVARSISSKLNLSPKTRSGIMTVALMSPIMKPDLCERALDAATPKGKQMGANIWGNEEKAESTCEGGVRPGTSARKAKAGSGNIQIATGCQCFWTRSCRRVIDGGKIQRPSTVVRDIMISPDKRQIDSTRYCPRPYPLRNRQKVWARSSDLDPTLTITA
ncbi:4575_t:CDS:2, partial [Acaulospora colombiana]